MELLGQVKFPAYSGVRCLMMPYIQGIAESVPTKYRKGYEDMLNYAYILKKGELAKIDILTPNNRQLILEARYG